MHMKKITTRITWTDEHVEQMLNLYFSFLASQLAGAAYTKAAPVRELAAAQGRSKGSIEAKMMNVSAVLETMGREWVTGYKPLKNFNKALLDQVTDHIKRETAQGAAA